MVTMYIGVTFGTNTVRMASNVSSVWRCRRWGQCPKTTSDVKSESVEDLFLICWMEVPEEGVGGVPTATQSGQTSEAKPG